LLSHLGFFLVSSCEKNKKEFSSKEIMWFI
jgi:hypothetical protein